jgi:hypothetical protein
MRRWPSRDWDLMTTGSPNFVPLTTSHRWSSDPIDSAGHDKNKLLDHQSCVGLRLWSLIASAILILKVGLGAGRMISEGLEFNRSIDLIDLKPSLLFSCQLVAARQTFP